MATPGAMEAYWRDDFKPLEVAGKAVLAALRADETAPDADLYRRIISSGPGSHLYFNSAETMVHRRTVPLPPYMTQQLKTTRMAMLMGLFPEARLVWMTVDDKLFLWSSDIASESPGGMEDFCSFAVPTGQCVVSVGLVRPKKGVFKDSVEWCLVVTTPEEVILCALTRSIDNNPESPNQNGVAHGKGTLRLIPTRYVMPTDSISLLSVCGTPDGRIILGGYDGCLYEMTYEPLTKTAMTMPTFEECLDQFYDEGKAFPKPRNGSDNSVRHGLLLAGKRTLSSVLPKSFTSSNPRKCRKLNHSANASSIASVIFPDFFTKATSAILGSGVSSSTGGPILKIVHDDERRCLYTLSTRGWICAFDLGTLSTPKKMREIKLTAVMDTERTARVYLEAVSKGRMYPPSSSSATLGGITFPGGGSSAQVGVGGMDGSRTILKLADSEKTAGRRAATRQDHSPGILTPVSLHVVSRRESGRLTLVAVTAGGLRYYLSSLSSSVLNTGPGQHMGTNRRTDPLAPSKRFTLCHVRSPPPVGEAGVVQDLPSFDAEASAGVEGYTPRVVARNNKIAPTDSAYYGDGVMVLAVEHKAAPPGVNRSTGSRVSKFLGDLIVAVGPDSEARKRVSTANGSSTNASDAPVMTAPGGISEKLSLPMAVTIPSAVEQPPVLPGGRILDIDVVSPTENSVLNLAVRSKTPTDSELGVGLVPAYVPNPRASSNAIVTSPTASSRAVIATQSSIDGGSVLLTLLKNFVLSRPLREGLVYRSQSSARSERASSGFKRETMYRISSRYGTKGFSVTAGGSVSGTGRVSVGRADAYSTTRSARLSPWLLRPSIAPLSPFALQHLLPSRDMVALNTGGLHFFTFKSVVTNLAEALMAPGVNVTTDKKVTEFFSSYGYPQGCAMCLSLAIGYGPVGTSDIFGAELESRARRAALSRGFVPKLVQQAEPQNGIASTSATSSDSAIPHGYDFHPSALYDGLMSLVSRLLRPVWFKPCVVVTESHKVKSMVGSETAFPAKVELLLDSATLEDVRKPLDSLLSMLREVFSPAVSSVPGLLQQNEDRMDVEYNSAGPHNVITGTMQYQRYMQNQNGLFGGTRLGLTVRETEAIARLLEERNLHSLYRLLARAVQLLRLLSLLHRAQYMPELCGIDWGLLHGLTMAQLAMRCDGQERVESLLNALVSSNLSSSSAVKPSAEADQLAGLLASECYLYFSPGSRFAYSGFRSATEALACDPTSSRRSALANDAANDLKQAARYWYSAPLITGRVLHSIQDESYDQIAHRAIQYESPLAKAAAALMQLRDVSSVVEVCLTTASNFGGHHKEAAVGARQDDQERMLPWERNLYHKRTGHQVEQRSGGSGTSSDTASSSTAIVVGANVTWTDALRSCHAIIFHHLKTLLDSPDSQLAREMVEACARSGDLAFKHALYAHLVSSHHEYALLKIRNNDIEKWLARPGGDKELLWRYYREQHNDTKAAEIMHMLACTDEKDVLLEERIAALTKSLQSYEDALRKSSADVQTSYSRDAGSAELHSELQRKYHEIDEQLEIAMLQNRVRQAVTSASLASKLDDSQLSKLQSSLIPVSDLYNSYAAHLQLFDVCLLLLHSCRHNDPSTIQSLWQSLICEELLPCSTRSPGAYQYLQTLMAGSLLDQKVTLLPDNTVCSFALFESGDWVESLKGRVISLGRDLCRNGADLAFPVAFLSSTLEGLRLAQAVASESTTPPTPWPPAILAGVGVPFTAIFQAYDEMAEIEERERMGGVNADRKLYHLSSTTDVLGKWVRVASTGSQGIVSTSEALRDLSRSSNFVLTRIEAYKTSLERMRGSQPDASDLIHHLDMIENGIRTLK